jgi:hypothetical protein
MRKDKRSEIAVAANLAGEGSRRGGAPRLTAASSRGTLLLWLQWNDPNGVYDDEAAEAEGFDPLTVDDAWDLIAEQVSDYL